MMRKPQTTGTEVVENHVVDPIEPVIAIATGTPFPRERPPRGGAYIRRKDGSLERIAPAQKNKEA